MGAASEKTGRLLRILGVAFGVAAVVGGMVGQGILRTPGIVASAAHSPELILALWLAGATMALISAFAYLELGTAIPCAGGPYDYIRRGYGPLAGVVTGWAAWLVQIMTMAFLAIVSAEFMLRLGIWPELGTSGLAVAILALFWAVNWSGTRIAGDSQILFSAFKGAALMALVVLLFAQPARAPLPPMQELSGPIGIAGIAVAMRAIFNTYAGWEDVVYFGEDMKKPERTLVRSMFAGIVGVAIIYLLVNAALLHILTPAQMARSEFAAADAAKVVLGPSGDLALTIFGLVSVAAITNLTLMKSSRISFALARSGHLPIRLSVVSATGTPRSALTVGVLLGAAFAATGTYETVVAASVAISLVLIIAVNFSVIRLRRIDPEMDRPFRVPLYPLPILLAIILHVALLAVVIFEDPIHSLQGLGILAVLAVVYFAIHRIAEPASKPAT